MRVWRDGQRARQPARKWPYPAMGLLLTLIIGVAALIQHAPAHAAGPADNDRQAVSTPRPTRSRETPTPRPTPDRSATCPGPFRSVSKPLTDLGKGQYVRMDGEQTGFRGGLYPDGSNVRPKTNNDAALAMARQITPRDAQGNPDPDGKIGMVVVGMSNAHHEFNRFEEMLGKRKDINPHLVTVNGAIAGRTAETWTDPDARTWQELAGRVKWRKLTPEQVQVAWVKQTLRGGGDFPEKSQALQADLATIARNLKAKYPNLKIAYFSSRTRGYTYDRGLSPEPLAFEGGYAVKWLVESQINGEPTLNYDPQRGRVNAPFITWGPYLWIDGQNPRSDGRIWTGPDMTFDCTHPSESGLNKVADMLMTFFMTEPTAVGWFRATP